MKKIILTTILFTLSFLLSNTLYSNETALFATYNAFQEDDAVFPSSAINYDFTYNNIGITASLFSGVGLHYKRNIDSNNAVKIVFLGWHSNSSLSTDASYDNKTTNTFFSFGLEYQYHFFRTNNFDGYALAAYRNWYEETNKKPASIDNTNSFGLGIGTEYQILKYIIINAEIGFRYSLELERKWSERSYRRYTEINLWQSYF